MALGDFLSGSVGTNGLTITTTHEGGAGVGTLATGIIATVTIKSSGFINTVSGVIDRNIAARPISKAANTTNTDIVWHTIHRAGSQNDGAQIHLLDSTIKAIYPADVITGIFTTNATSGALTNNSTLPYPDVILASTTIPGLKITDRANCNFIAFAMYGLDTNLVTLTDATASGITKTASGVVIPRMGTPGPATGTFLYQSSFNVNTDNAGGRFNLGSGYFRIRSYPRIGTSSNVYDTLIATTRPKQYPDLEIYLDPLNAESANDTRWAFVDNTQDVNLNTVWNGPFQEWEYAIGSGNETPIQIINNAASSPIKFNYLEEGPSSAYKITIASVTGTITPGTVFEKPNNPPTRHGIVIDYNPSSRVLRYITANNGSSEGSAEFESGNLVYFHNSNPTGITAVATGIMISTSTAIGLTASAANVIGNGEIIFGTTSLASGITTAVPTGNWSASPAVNSHNAYRYQNEGINGLKTANGGRADGSIVYLRKGNHLPGHPDNPNVDTTTSFYYVTITRATGLTQDEARLTSYWNNEGYYTRCIQLSGISIIPHYFQSIIRTDPNPFTGRSVAAPILLINDCKFTRNDSQAPCSYHSSFDGVYIVNSLFNNIGNGMGGVIVLDSKFSNIGGGDVWDGGLRAVNIDLKNIIQKGSAHTDIHQIDNDQSNVVLYNIRGVDLEIGQQAPFYPASDGNIIDNVAYVNVLQESMTGASELGPGEYDNFLFWNCTLNSTLQLTDSGAGEPTYTNFSIRNSYLSQMTKSEGGGAITIYPSMIDNCHIRTVGAAPSGTSVTAGGTVNNHFISTVDADQKSHFLANPTGTLGNRTVSTQQPFLYDLFGQAWATNGTAPIGVGTTGIAFSQSISTPALLSLLNPNHYNSSIVMNLNGTPVNTGIWSVTVVPTGATSGVNISITIQNISASNQLALKCQLENGWGISGVNNPQPENWWAASPSFKRESLGNYVNSSRNSRYGGGTQGIYVPVIVTDNGVSGIVGISTNYPYHHELSCVLGSGNRWAYQTAGNIISFVESGSFTAPIDWYAPSESRTFNIWLRQATGVALSTGVAVECAQPYINWLQTTFGNLRPPKMHGRIMGRQLALTHLVSGNNRGFDIVNGLTPLTVTGWNQFFNNWFPPATTGLNLGISGYLIFNIAGVVSGQAYIPSIYNNMPTGLANRIGELNDWERNNGIKTYFWCGSAYTSYQTGAFNSSLISMDTNVTYSGGSLTPQFSLASAVKPIINSTGVLFSKQNIDNGFMIYSQGVGLDAGPEIMTHPWLEPTISGVRYARPGKIPWNEGYRTDRTQIYGPSIFSSYDVWDGIRCPLIERIFPGHQNFVAVNPPDFSPTSGYINAVYNVESQGYIPIIFFNTFTGINYPNNPETYQWFDVGDVLGRHSQILL